MPPNVLQIVGYKNTDKTTLIERLTERLTALGYRVGTIKHDAHRFEVDHAGTDSWRHRQAGAASEIVLVREAEDAKLVRTFSHVATVVCWLPVPTFDVPVFTQDGTDDLVEWIVRRYFS